MTRLKHTLILLSILFCCCSRPPEQNDREEFDRLYGSHIAIPHNLHVIPGKPAGFGIASPDAKATIVQLVEMSDCKPCLLEDLYKWHLFDSHVYQRDSTDSEAEIMLIIFSKKTTEIETFLKFYNFELPVYVDTCGAFSALNDVPRNKNYRTFLLSADNKVEIIGSPFLNEDIKNMYADYLSKIKKTEH